MGTSQRPVIRNPRRNWGAGYEIPVVFSQRSNDLPKQRIPCKNCKACSSKNFQDKSQKGETTNPEKKIGQKEHEILLSLNDIELQLEAEQLVVSAMTKQLQKAEPDMKTIKRELLKVGEHLMRMLESIDKLEIDQKFSVARKQRKLLVQDIQRSQDQVDNLL